MQSDIPIHATTVFRRSKEVQFTQLDDELLAVDAQAGYCYSLNETAGRVWELLAAPTTVASICSRLGREYTVDPGRCEREVIVLLRELSEAGLAQVSDGASD